MNAAPLLLAALSVTSMVAPLAISAQDKDDGPMPGTAHGADIDHQGSGTVTERRLCQLIRQPQPIADRQLEIDFLDPGVQIFVFTFG